MKKWIHRPAEIITVEWDIEISPQESQIVASSILDTRSREYQSFVEGMIANFSIAGYKLHRSSDYTHPSNRKNSQSEYYTFVKLENNVVVQVIVHVRISDHVVESDVGGQKRQRYVDRISQEIVEEYKSPNKRPLSIPINIIFNDETGIESYEEALAVIRKSIASLDRQLKLEQDS